MSLRVPDLSVLDVGPLARQAGLPSSMTSATRVPAISIAPATVQQTPAREQELMFKMVCLLISHGETPSAAARKVGCTEDWVRKIVAAPVGMDMIVQMQHDSNPDPGMRLKRMSSIALDVQTRLMLSATVSDTVKAKVSQDVADRAFGKAIQVTENRNLNFDFKDAVKLDESIKAADEKLARIEQMRKRLVAPVGTSA